MNKNQIKKAVRTVALTTTMLAATFGSVAYAGTTAQEVEYGELHNGQPVNNGGTGIGIGGSSDSTSNANANAGAFASTGPVNANGGEANATGGNANATGGTSSSNAATGPVTVNPSQTTVNKFRSFVGTNAPNLQGSVDGCLAVLGWSAAVNVFGATGIGLGGGSQHTEYVEQCAAVKSAFEVWNRAGGDVAKETFAVQMLINALPTYGKPAMDQAVKRINTYIDTHGDQEPDSVMSIFGAQSFRHKVSVAAGQQQQSQGYGGVTLNVYPVVQTKETVRTVHTVAPKKAPVPKPRPKAAVKKAAPDCK